MHRAVPLVLVVALAIATATTPARAAPRLELGGDGCDLSALTLDAPASAVVHVETSRDGEQVIATITFEDGRTRVVHAATCAELGAATALVIDIALADAPVAPAPAVAAVAILAMPPPPAPVARAATDVDLLAAGAGAVSSHGLQEQLIVGARWKRAARSLGVELRVAALDRQDVAAAAQIDVWSAALSASPCLHRGAFAGCVTASAGTVEGSGHGLADGARAFTPRVAGGLRVTWEHALTARYALRLQLDADAAATTTRFDVDHMTVWASDRVTIWGGAGVISHFP